MNHQKNLKDIEVGSDSPKFGTAVVAKAGKYGQSPQYFIKES